VCVNELFSDLCHQEIFEERIETQSNDWHSPPLSDPTHGLELFI
jgi:hypothetical protein